MHQGGKNVFMEDWMNQTLSKRWLLDAAFFTGFLACFFIDLTGVGLHQWLGIAAGAVAAVHLASHQKWVNVITGRFFGKTSRRARLYYLVDALLLAGFALMVGTGLGISTWLGLSPGAYDAWRAAHVLVSVASLLLVVLKIGLHAGWILAVGRKLFASLAGSPGTPAIAPVSGPPGRRAFLKLMGGVGAVSLLVASLSLQGLAQDGQLTTTEIETGDAQAPSRGRFRASAAFSASGVCAAQCGRRCAFPGRCRRYVDQDTNGRCDLGECQG
jgi:hypothetical protein